MIACPKCHSVNIVNNGPVSTSAGGEHRTVQRFKCKVCGHSFREVDVREYPIFIKYLARFLRVRRWRSAVGGEFEPSNANVAEMMQMNPSVVEKWVKDVTLFDNAYKDFVRISSYGGEVIVVFRFFEVAIRPRSRVGATQPIDE